MSDCSTYRDRLQDWAEGRLAEGVQGSVDAHIATCEACRAIADGYLLSLGDACASVDLTAGVLERTSGSPCARAHELICAHVDDDLERTDGMLMRLHLESCPECASLASALARMPVDLAVMAELEPGRSFAPAVIAQTSARPSRWDLWATRLRELAASMVRRPRFAYEAAYVGAALLWLTVGPAVSPLIAATKIDTVEPAEVFGRVTQQATIFGERAWSATGGAGLEAVGDVGSALHARYERSEPAIVGVREHGGELGSALLKLDIETGGTAFRNLTGDLATAWSEFATTPADNDKEE